MSKCPYIKDNNCDLAKCDEFHIRADEREKVIDEVDKYLRELSNIKSGCGEWIEEHDERVRAYERAKVLGEVTVGINSIINEYAIDGKVLTCLITKYIERKCDWLNK